MRPLFLLLLLQAICFSPSVAAQADTAESDSDNNKDDIQKKLFSEIAVYRINNRVVYHSELDQHLQALEAVRCLPGQKFLLKALGLESDDLAQIPEIEGHLSSLKENADFLDLLLQLLVAQSYANRFRLSMNRAQLEREFPTGQCSLEGSFATWPSSLRQIVQAEVYFRNRFLGAEQAQRGTSEHREADLKELKRFINSLSQKFDQGVFYRDR